VAGIRLSLLIAASLAAGCTGTTAPASAPHSAAATPGATVASSTPAPPPAAAPATLTIEQGVEADGPGNSVTEALAYRGSDSQLVNGTLLRDANGRIWLCEAVTESPLQCPEPRLLVTNWVPGPDDGTFVSGPGLHIADGARWVERVQLFGFVRPGTPG
jgi:ABC-type transport system substrate-binding protein